MFVEPKDFNSRFVLADTRTPVEQVIGCERSVSADVVVCWGMMFEVWTASIIDSGAVIL